MGIPIPRKTVFWSWVCVTAIFFPFSPGTPACVRVTSSQARAHDYAFTSVSQQCLLQIDTVYSRLECVIYLWYTLFWRYRKISTFHVETTLNGRSYSLKCVRETQYLVNSCYFFAKSLCNIINVNICICSFFIAIYVWQWVTDAKPRLRRFGPLFVIHFVS